MVQTPNGGTNYNIRAKLLYTYSSLENTADKMYPIAGKY